VTECLGGSMELSEEELGLRYQVRIMTLSSFEPTFDLAHRRHLLRDLRASATPA